MLKIKPNASFLSLRFVAIGSLMGLILSLALGYLYWRSKAATSVGQGEVVAIDGAENLNFLILGDQGSGNVAQKKVALGMEELCNQTAYAGVVLLGDNFYPSGVASVDDIQWKEKFEDIYGHGCLGKLNFYATLGNHDYKGNALAEIDYSNHSTQWKLPGRFYGIRLNDLVEFVFFDSTFLDFCFDDKSCSLNFLNSRLNSLPRPRWQIAVGHHPFRSSSSKGFTYDGKDLRSWILRKLVCGRADLALFGHSHHMELRQDPDCSTPFAILGSGGADLVDVKPQGAPLFLKKEFGFGDIQISRNQMQLRFFDADANVLYVKNLK